VEGHPKMRNRKRKKEIKQKYKPLQVRTVRMCEKKQIIIISYGGGMPYAMHAIHPRAVSSSMPVNMPLLASLPSLVLPL
jgi:hypothetical protein